MRRRGAFRRLSFCLDRTVSLRTVGALGTEVVLVRGPAADLGANGFEHGETNGISTED